MWKTTSTEKGGLRLPASGNCFWIVCRFGWMMLPKSTKDKSIQTNPSSGRNKGTSCLPNALLCACALELEINAPALCKRVFILSQLKYFLNTIRFLNSSRSPDAAQVASSTRALYDGSSPKENMWTMLHVLSPTSSYDKRFELSEHEDGQAISRDRWYVGLGNEGLEEKYVFHLSFFCLEN